jgi:hypothetical protein
VCVSETRSAPNQKPVNNQASVEYHTSSEVGIPILRSQTYEITDIGHGHQSYTVDPCRQNIAQPPRIHCGSMQEDSN